MTDLRFDIVHRSLPRRIEAEPELTEAVPFSRGSFIAAGDTYRDVGNSRSKDIGRQTVQHPQIELAICRKRLSAAFSNGQHSTQSDIRPGTGELSFFEEHFRRREAHQERRSCGELHVFNPKRELGEICRTLQAGELKTLRRPPGAQLL